MDVIVVESPAKAKTVGKYLGDGYVVLASYGHVRDLPAKDGSVRPDDDFAMTYQTDPRSVRRLNDIAAAVRKAEHLYLATDPDREGEAISWHVLAALRDMNALDAVPARRVVFNEVTRSSVRAAMAHPRELDMNLVNAQQARRALDYLVGFTLSPVLWRKLPGSRSAGRVQSVALRLVCERETEIESFRPREYWTVEADFRTVAGHGFAASLVRLDGAKLGKFALENEASARAAASAIEQSPGFAVGNVESKATQRHPPPPFTTSTLQQEASRKLRSNARKTMSTAQRLYEGVEVGDETVGLITYMRTDGVQMAAEAVAASRRVIGAEFGEEYVPERARVYRTKAKNAQEAHEAIRPTDFSRLPSQLGALEPDQRRLYELIWKRAVASQMASARLQQTAVAIRSEDGRTELRATGQVVLFDGFLRLYREGRDDVGTAEQSQDRDEERALPAIEAGDALWREAVRPSQHFTEPPPRYTEASLVRKLEELGIGRPSTYASILSVLQERDYVRIEKNRFVPEDRGRIVTAFLACFFERYVEYGFTADLETQLDRISAGDLEWKAVLRGFWEHFIRAVDETRNLRMRDVLEVLDSALGPHVFRADEQQADPRRCPQCADGRLSIKIGRYGAFVGCSNYPECRHTRPLDADADARPDAGPRTLGTDPDSGREVSVRTGPYGDYVQLGEGGDSARAKRTSVPASIPTETLDLSQALALLALPREIGAHPETGERIVAGIGRYGPYVLHQGRYASLQADDDVLSVGLNRAVALLADAETQRRGPGPGRELGVHPDDGKPITVHRGRYGPYVKHGRTNATLPRGTDPDATTLADAVSLLAEKKTSAARRTRGGGSAKTSKTRTPRARARRRSAASTAKPAGSNPPA